MHMFKVAACGMVSPLDPLSLECCWTALRIVGGRLLRVGHSLSHRARGVVLEARPDWPALSDR